MNFARTARYLENDCDVALYGGHGDCIDELESEARATNNLFITGIVPLQEILSIEKGASILVNPRPSTEEFTKYSFPSKTAEYMLAGVPTIMYELASLPDEYKDKLYFFRTRDPERMAEEIKSILRKYDEAKEKALKAKRFIVEEKNSIHQAERILNFIEKVINN